MKNHELRVLPKDFTYSIKSETLIVEDGEDEIYGKLYAPKDDGKYPAIILSHGFNGTHADFAAPVNNLKAAECFYSAV